MKATNLKLFVAALTVTAFGMNVSAQSVLDETSFEVLGTGLVRPTGESVNVRERPSTSAPKCTDMNGFEIQATKHRLYELNTELPQWWSAAGGYISKKVCKLSVGKPITDDMLNRFFGWCDGYDLGEEWLVSRTASKRGLMVCYHNDGFPQLWLGKMVDNVLVFRYKIYLDIKVDEQNADPNRLTPTFEEREDMGRIYTLTVGTNWVQEVPWGGMGTMKTLNFSKLTDKILEKMFEDAIRKWDWKQDNFYLNSELLSDEYANYVLG